jgi:hypothetical protein
VRITQFASSAIRANRQNSFFILFRQSGRITVNNEHAQKDDFREKDPNSPRNGRAEDDKQAKPAEKIAKNRDEKKRNPPHGDRCDPELKDERCGKDAGQPKSPHWAIEPGFRKSEDQFSQEELERFRGLAIPPLGRRFLELANAFETYLNVGAAWNAGYESLNEVSRNLEERQDKGIYPKELPVSVASLHRAVGQVEEFFRSHFKLKLAPRLVARPGEGLPVKRLTAAGNIAWELIRTHLVAMGYDDVWDSR